MTIKRITTAPPTEHRAAANHFEIAGRLMTTIGLQYNCRDMGADLRDLVDLICVELAAAEWRGYRRARAEPMEAVRLRGVSPFLTASIRRATGRIEAGEKINGVAATLALNDLVAIVDAAQLYLDRNKQ